MIRAYGKLPRYVTHRAHGGAIIGSHSVERRCAYCHRSRILALVTACVIACVVASILVAAAR